MVYPYNVNYNGVFYPVGADVPTGETPVKVEEEKVEETKNEVVDEVKEKAITKSEINVMNKADLLNLAYKEGFDKDVREMTNGELKKALIKHFGL